MNRNAPTIILSIVILAGTMTFSTRGTFGQVPRPSLAPESSPTVVEPAPHSVNSNSVPPTGVPVSGAYRLNPADRIVITVFGEPDLTTDARIAEDGTIRMPLIGQITVAGKTVNEAVGAITYSYDKDYLVNPVVTILLSEQRKATVTLLGHFNRQGPVEIPLEGMPITQVIAQAGGFTRLASPTKVTVKRVVNGKEEVHKVDAKEQAEDPKTLTFRCLPGDVITVAERYF